MTEFEQMEEYNRQFNDDIAKRPIKTLIMCTRCNGSKGHYFTYFDPEFQPCPQCSATGYEQASKDRLPKSPVLYSGMRISDGTAINSACHYGVL